MPVPAALAGRSVGWLALLCLTLPAWPAAAAEWYVQSGIAQDFGYDDNYELDPNRSQSAWLTTTTLDATVGGRSPLLDLRLGGNAAYTRYFGADRTSSDAQTLFADATRTGRRSLAELELSLLRDTTLLDPEESGPTTQANERRLTFDLDPSFTYNLTPVDLIEARGGWQHRTYPGLSEEERNVFEGAAGSSGGTFVDYNFWTADLEWRRSLTQRVAFGPDARFGYLDSARDETTTIGVLARVDYRYTNLIDFSFGLGPSYYWNDSQDRSDGRLERDSSAGAGIMADGRAAVQLAPRTRMTLSLGHGVNPSGDDGAASETTRIGLGIEHRLSRRLGLLLDSVYFRERDLGSGGEDQNDRDFLEAGPSLAWEVQRSLEASLSYRFRHEDDEDSGDAQSNAVFVRLAYRLPEGRFPW